MGEKLVELNNVERIGHQVFRSPPTVPSTFEGLVLKVLQGWPVNAGEFDWIFLTARAKTALELAEEDAKKSREALTGVVVAPTVSTASFVAPTAPSGRFVQRETPQEKFARKLAIVKARERAARTEAEQKEALRQEALKKYSSFYPVGDTSLSIVELDRLFSILNAGAYQDGHTLKAKEKRKKRKASVRKAVRIGIGVVAAVVGGAAILAKTGTGATVAGAEAAVAGGTAEATVATVAISETAAVAALPIIPTATTTTGFLGTVKTLGGTLLAGAKNIRSKVTELQEKKEAAVSTLTDFFGQDVIEIAKAALAPDTKFTAVETTPTTTTVGGFLSETSNILWIVAIVGLGAALFLSSRRKR